MTKYLSYADFLTPHSGLIQIKKYADINNKMDLMKLFDAVGELTKAVRKEMWEELVGEMGYFR